MCPALLVALLNSSLPDREVTPPPLEVRLHQCSKSLTLNYPNDSGVLRCHDGSVLDVTLYPVHDLRTGEVLYEFRYSYRPGRRSRGSEDRRAYVFQFGEPGFKLFVGNLYNAEDGFSVVPQGELGTQLGQ